MGGEMSRGDDRIAIVGMSCRLPGAPDTVAFWRLLRDGLDAITPPPPGRAGDLPAGFLDRVDAFDAAGKPAHQRGVSSEPGVYFVGLPWLSRRGSTFIWGVWHDAKHIADHIAIQRTYAEYRDAGQCQVRD